MAEDGPDSRRLIGPVRKKAWAEVTIVDNGTLAVDAKTRQTLVIIAEGSGTQFTPAIVEAFLRHEAEFAELARSLVDEPAGSDEERSASRACAHQG